MQTDDLIRSLASGTLEPVGRRFAVTRITVSLALSAGVVAVAIMASIGLRHDLLAAMAGEMFWIKLGYVASILLVALPVGVAMRRPDADVSRAWLMLVVPFTLIMIGALVERAAQPVDLRIASMLGQSWRQCPLLIAGFSLPIFASLIFAFRRFATTRPAITGGFLGIASGAAAACLYCLHCPESSLAFVAIWYSLGVLLAGMIGFVTGSRLLRW